MDHRTSFEVILQEELSRAKRSRGPVRRWRASLPSVDKAAFDDAVDDRAGVSTAALQRAVVVMGGVAINYGMVYRYRAAVRCGGER